MLTEKEMQQLLAWNNTTRDYPKNQTIVDLFEQQVEKTPEEKRLVDIWCQVLGIDKIGIHDNFFELGGHSLQAVQLVSKISLATNIEISVKQLFLYPTIAQLATLLDKPAPTRPAKRKNHSIGK
jgi:acyl carrier protein